MLSNGLDRSIREAGLRARMLLQIHDELVFEAPDEEIPRLAEVVRREMTTALDLTVPLEVDLSAGPHSAVILTTDLTEAYVYENSAYST